MQLSNKQLSSQTNTTVRPADKPKHTPGMVHLGDIVFAGSGSGRGHPSQSLVSQNGASVLYLSQNSGNAEEYRFEANAARVVLCWNSHDALAEALGGLLPYVTFGDANTPAGRAVAKARAALAAAKEKP